MPPQNKMETNSHLIGFVEFYAPPFGGNAEGKTITKRIIIAFLYFWKQNERKWQILGARCFGNKWEIQTIVLSNKNLHKSDYYFKIIAEMTAIQLSHFKPFLFTFLSVC